MSLSRSGALRSSAPTLVAPRRWFHMSTSNRTTDASSTNFTAIFEAASNKYKTLTGQDLQTHPLATELESNSDSPDSILGVFRKQAQALNKSRSGDDKLMKHLTPIVNILFTFSATGGAGLSLVSFNFSSIPVLQQLSSKPFPPATTIFTGIGVLLGVSPFRDT